MRSEFAANELMAAGARQIVQPRVVPYHSLVCRPQSIHIRRNVPRRLPLWRRIAYWLIDWS